MFGINICNDIKGTNKLANVVTATRFSSGGTAHDTDLINDIMKRVASADNQRNRTAVPGLKGFENLVTNKLQELVDAEDNNFFTKDKSYTTATLECKSSAERLTHRGRASQWKASRRISS